MNASKACSARIHTVLDDSDTSIVVGQSLKHSTNKHEQQPMEMKSSTRKHVELHAASITTVYVEAHTHTQHKRSRDLSTRTCSDNQRAHASRAEKEKFARMYRVLVVRSALTMTQSVDQGRRMEGHTPPANDHASCQSNR
jgi:hypothetical protein